ncbi:MAG: hypothetical protein WD716_09980 [Fimbriimonadaceae bacterium]
MRKQREWAGLTGRYGAAGESGAWKVVYDHYYQDRLKEAYHAAADLGAGTAAHGLVGFRMIEGEYITRQAGELHQATPWLSIETIEEESPEPIQSVASRVLRACDTVAERFGFEHGPPVMVSVLAKESNVPWMPGRFGYCIDKFPYDKICIPNSSLHDADDLQHVIAHEYAHVVTLNLSEGRCPLWLDEAVAMVAGGGASRGAWRAFASGREEWLPAHELNASYLRDREDSRERDVVWRAYLQSAVIGAYLASLKGERALGDLMRAFSNNTLLQDLMMRVRGNAPTDEALGEVYGLGTRALFEKSYSWLVGQARG